jgi:antitoxin HicB
MKNLDYYLSLNYRKLVYQDEDGDYIVEVSDLPGCVSDGPTPAEAFENLRGAMSSWITSRIAAGLDVPEPKTVEDYSGRVLLRMPQFLHRRLAEQASTEGASLNQYMVSLLSDGSARVNSAVQTAPVPVRVNAEWHTAVHYLRETLQHRLDRKASARWFDLRDDVMILGACLPSNAEGQTFSNLTYRCLAHNNIVVRQNEMFGQTSESQPESELGTFSDYLTPPGKWA